ncbi:MAG TPA: hypothetical protein VFU95_08550 [Telluria sp.]|nr:hypothetical protein [Telluria sp.]
MAIVLFDSHILIDHLLGIAQATIEPGSCDDAAVSAISWMEAACKLTPPQIALFDASLADAGVKVIQTTPLIMRGALAWHNVEKASGLHHHGHGAGP